MFDGATELYVLFDPRSSTEDNYDNLTINGVKFCGGRNGSDKNFPTVAPLVVKGNKFKAKFISDSSNNDWGVRFIVFDSILLGSGNVDDFIDDDRSTEGSVSVVDSSCEAARKTPEEVVTYFENRTNDIQSILIDMPVLKCGYFEVHFSTSSSLNSFVQVGAKVAQGASSRPLKHLNSGLVEDGGVRVCLGIGSSSDSFAVDGIDDPSAGSYKWTNNGSVPYSTKLLFKRGAVLGVSLDARSGKIQYYCGTDTSPTPAFQGGKMTWSSGLCPAFSFTPGQRIFVNLGQSPFVLRPKAISVLKAYNATELNGQCQVWDDSWSVWKVASVTDLVVEDLSSKCIMGYYRTGRKILDKLHARGHFRSGLPTEEAAVSATKKRTAQKRGSFVHYSSVKQFEMFLQFSTASASLLTSLIPHDLCCRRMLIAGVAYTGRNNNDAIRIDSLKPVQSSTFFAKATARKGEKMIMRPPPELELGNDTRMLDLSVAEIIQSLELDNIFGAVADSVAQKLSRNKKTKRAKRANRTPGGLPGVLTTEGNTSTPFTPALDDSEAGEKSSAGSLEMKIFAKNPLESKENALSSDVSALNSGLLPSGGKGASTLSDIILIDDDITGSLSSSPQVARAAGGKGESEDKDLFLNMVAAAMASGSCVSADVRRVEPAILVSRMLRMLGHMLGREAFKNPSNETAGDNNVKHAVDNLDNYNTPDELYTLLVVQHTLVELNAVKLSCFMISQGGVIFDEGIELAMYLMKLLNKTSQREFMRMMTEDGAAFASIMRTLTKFSSSIASTWGVDKLHRLAGGKRVLKFLQNLCDGQNTKAQDLLGSIEDEKGDSLFQIIVKIMEIIFAELTYLGTDAVKTNAVEIKYLLDVAQQAMDSLSDFAQGPHHQIQTMLLEKTKLLLVLKDFFEFSRELRFATIGALAANGTIPPLQQLIPGVFGIAGLKDLQKQLENDEQWRMCDMLTEVQVSMLSLVATLMDKALLDSPQETAQAHIAKVDCVLENLDIKSLILAFKECWAGVVFKPKLHTMKYLKTRFKLGSKLVIDDDDENDHENSFGKQLKRAMSIVTDNTDISFNPAALLHLSVSTFDLLVQAWSLRTGKQIDDDVSLAFSLYKNITLLCDNASDTEFIANCKPATAKALQSYVTMWTPAADKKALVSTDEAMSFDSYFAQIEVVEGSGQLTRVYFPIPRACRMQMKNGLVKSAMTALTDTVNRESPEKKLDDFLDKSLQIRDVIFQQQYILEDESNRFRELFRFFTSRERIWIAVTLFLTFYINIMLLLNVKATNEESNFYLDDNDLSRIREAGYAHLFMSFILMFNYLLGAARVNILSGFKWKQNVQDGLIPLEGLNFLGAGADALFEIMCAITPNFGWAIIFLVGDYLTLYYILFIIFSALGIFVNPGFFCFHVLDIVTRISLLGYVIKSVTMNFGQVMVTFILGAVLMWIYSVVGVYCFGYNQYNYGDSPDFEWPGTLADSFWQHLDFGLRGPPIFSSYKGNMSVGKYIFDISYQIFIIIVMVAIITGIIIDTFGDLRAARGEIEADQENVCFICAIEREVFERNR